jgi:hypothetical protein
MKQSNNPNQQPDISSPPIETDDAQSTTSNRQPATPYPQPGISNLQSAIPDQQSKIINNQSPISDSPWMHCPVCLDTKRIAALSKDMIRAIRKLRQDLKACNSCSISPGDCPIRQNLDAQIQSAVQEVMKELNLRL